MKRREVMTALVGAAAALGAAPADAQALSDETVRDMLRFLGGVEPSPSEVANVRAFLLSFRRAIPPDPEVEPAVVFDPRFPE